MKWLFAPLLLWVLGVQALPDPTLPPPQARASAVGLAAPAASAEPARPVLQGIRPGSQPSALVSGRLLRPGQAVAGFVLVRIEADAVLMRDPQGQPLRLSLWPRNDQKPLTKEVRP